MAKTRKAIATFMPLAPASFLTSCSGFSKAWPGRAHPLDRCREARAKAYGSMWGPACATCGAEVQNLHYGAVSQHNGALFIKVKPILSRPIGCSKSHKRSPRLADAGLADDA